MGETKLLNVPGLRREVEQIAAEAAEAGVPGTVAMLPGEALALVEAVEAARAVRWRHPGNAESADLVLDRCLGRFDFGDGR